MYNPYDELALMTIEVVEEALHTVNGVVTFTHEAVVNAAVDYVCRMANVEHPSLTPGQIDQMWREALKRYHRSIN